MSLFTFNIQYTRPSKDCLSTSYMQKMIQLIILITLMGLLALAWPQEAGSAAIPDDEAGKCRYGAEHMIVMLKQGLSETKSRRERIEKQRKLVDEWASRLEKGEDPCLVYMDIQKTVTTF